MFRVHEHQRAARGIGLPTGRCSIYVVCILQATAAISASAQPTAVTVNVSKFPGSAPPAVPGSASVSIDGQPHVIGLTDGSQVAVTITDITPPSPFPPYAPADQCPGGTDPTGTSCVRGGWGSVRKWEIVTSPTLGFGFPDLLQIQVVVGSEICSASVHSGYTLFFGCRANFFSAWGPAVGQKTHVIRVLPMPAGENCQGDSDGDGDVDQDDLDIVLFNFGTSGWPPYTNGDNTGDGRVDQDDIDRVLFTFNVYCT